MFQSPSLRGSGRFTARRRHDHCQQRCFNPLHCGAVVASEGSGAARSAHQLRVSIPFIAGQWSLLIAAAALAALAAWFQSPSLRGSGRFSWVGGDAPEYEAMFQSPSLRGSGRFSLKQDTGYIPRHLFQSPSLRGSGRFFV